MEHFTTLKNVILYIRNNPDMLLAFCHHKHHPAQCVSLIHSIVMDFTVAQHSTFDGDVLVPSAPIGLIDAAFVASISAKSSSDSPLRPPFMDTFADAAFGTHLFDCKNFTGGLATMAGMAIGYICRKQQMLAENSTVAEIFGAMEMGKFIQWLCLFMLDLGVPYHGPIAMAEDNNAMHLIAHGGKVTQNVRLVEIGAAAMREVGSQANHADHFTKILLGPPFIDHTMYMMGIHFLTTLHLLEVA